MVGSASTKAVGGVAQAQRARMHATNDRQPLHGWVHGYHHFFFPFSDRVNRINCLLEGMDAREM
jgi:hypothetical protein